MLIQTGICCGDFRAAGQPAPVQCLPPSTSELARYYQIALSASKEAAVEAARSNASMRTLESLGEIRVPTLIVQGRHDRSRTPEHGALMCEHLPDASLVVLENSGHTPQLEEPTAFHAAAISFILALH
jgi:pimeloyl-ACP methyl ester carboxylesterase